MAAAVEHDALHAAIEDSLRRRFDDGIATARAYGEEFAALWLTTAAGAVGGKLLRPRLLVDAFRELTGAADPSDAVELATAVELLHYSFLLHDDVIDGDVVRRGRPNVIGRLRDDVDRADAPDVERATHWGRTGAILMGDLLLTAAVLGFARVDVPSAVRSRLLTTLENAVSETVAGELADVGFSDGVLAADLPSILQMTARKTAVYSVELPLRAAAVLAGRSIDAEEALAAIGRRLGLAYQLQDDLLSVFGDPQEHGKDPHTDLREGKETAIIAYARMTSAWASIAPRFGTADLTGAEAAELRLRLRDCGAEGFVENLVAEQLDDAIGLIDEAVRGGLLPDGMRSVLLGFVERISGRTA
ncbi:polyprenyl synthetase family protein [Streptomyces sp. AC495_CC817]|uniref:polyprenyl synthetase family protein n=1 Tax=Streptomyces sp. AC495_CC817 TaxID=2823900 RepID=UPI001C25F00E|nr:polyprenyl synthetase family protein [Streptomyces sp. AC495_CC817]